MALTTFESLDGQNSYTFPTVPGDQKFSFNARKLRTKFTTIPGADGGVDENGTGLAPRPAGLLTVDLYLDTSDAGGRSAMQALRDAFNKMQAWGYGILTDTLNGSARYCIGRPSSIDMPEQRQRYTDIFQPITLTFECPEPYWLTAGNENLWNGSNTWNGAINWGGTGLNSITGSGSFTVSPSGSAVTLGRFVLLVTGATAFNQLIVRRTVLGGVKDELTYNGALVQNDELEFDPRNQWALLNGTDVLSALSFISPDWLRLLPGSNTIEVYLDDSAAQVSCVVRYLDRYT